MEFNEIVEHEAQLRHVETIKINAEKKKEYVENTLSIRASTKGEVIDNKTGYSSLYVIVENDGYILEVNKRGKFQLSNGISNKKKAIEFMEIQGIRLLWSFAREDIYEISSKMLPKPIMLPTIDVMKTLRKSNK